MSEKNYLLFLGLSEMNWKQTIVRWKDKAVALFLTEDRLRSLELDAFQ